MSDRRGSLPSWSLLVALVAPGIGCLSAQPLRTPPPDGAAAPDGDGAAEAPRPHTCFPRDTLSGANQPGDFCTSPEQCQHAPDEMVVCTASNPREEELKIARCHRFVRGKLGDPCSITLTTSGQLEGGSPGVAGTVPDASGYCDMREYLECDFVQHLCRALPPLGQDCATLLHCVRGSRCELGTCVAGHALGASCQGILDFTDQPECEASAHCDIAMNTCVPLVPDGQKCDYDPECASGVCQNGTCAPAGTCPR